MCSLSCICKYVYIYNYTYILIYVYEHDIYCGKISKRNPRCYPTSWKCQRLNSRFEFRFPCDFFGVGLFSRHMCVVCCSSLGFYDLQQWGVIVPCKEHRQIFTPDDPKKVKTFLSDVAKKHPTKNRTTSSYWMINYQKTDFSSVWHKSLHWRVPSEYWFPISIFTFISMFWTIWNSFNPHCTLKRCSWQLHVHLQLDLNTGFGSQTANGDAGRYQYWMASLAWLWDQIPPWWSPWCRIESIAFFSATIRGYGFLLICWPLIFSMIS